jgi:hypothetical protein
VFNSKKVSQERVMGISFVDILIQAVFLLLLILMVGYVDPIIQTNYEFHEAGKDLCNKINKDSPQSCVEFIKNKNVSVTTINNTDPSKDFCKKRGLSSENCKKTLDNIAGNLDFWPCIPPSSSSQLVRSSFWTIRAPGEIVFNKFSDEYISYLKRNNFSDKLKKIDVINLSEKNIYSPVEVISTFGFIREENCFHEYSTSRPGRFSDADLAKDFAALRSLRK